MQSFRTHTHICTHYVDIRHSTTETHTHTYTDNMYIFVLCHSPHRQTQSNFPKRPSDHHALFGYTGPLQSTPSLLLTHSRLISIDQVSHIQLHHWPHLQQVFLTLNVRRISITDLFPPKVRSTSITYLFPPKVRSTPITYLFSYSFCGSS